MHRARRMWTLFEPVHAVTYFTPQAKAAGEAVGLHGFWQLYCAQRAAPLGAVSAEVAGAAFYGFGRDRLAPVLPSVWQTVSPQTALEARSQGAVESLRPLLPAAVRRDLEEMADLASEAARRADCSGRVLAAANQALPRPADPLAALWQACTTLREHRGDGHIAVLVAAGVTPLCAHLLKIASGEVDDYTVRRSRNWPEEDWAAASASLRECGWTGADGSLTEAGRAGRQRIEQDTDRCADLPWQRLGDEQVERLASLLHPLAQAVVDAGVLPMPNPIGVPAPVTAA
ncbi:MAG: SCO6745 family protein [Actinomycetes bacterium]